MAKFGIKCILFDSFYHADMHQGNVLFIKEEENYKLGILDFGVMGNLTREEQNDFFLFFQTLSNDDFKAAAVHIIENLVEPKKLIEALSKKKYKILVESLATITYKAFKVDKVLGPEEMYQINSILYSHKLKLVRSFCKIELALAISDSVCKYLSQNTSYIENMSIVVKEMFPTDLLDY